MPTRALLARGEGESVHGADYIAVQLYISTAGWIVWCQYIVHGSHRDWWDGLHIETTMENKIVYMGLITSLFSRFSSINYLLNSDIAYAVSPVILGLGGRGTDPAATPTHFPQARY